MNCDHCKFVFTLDEAKGDISLAKHVRLKGPPGFQAFVHCPRCLSFTNAGRYDYRMPLRRRVYSKARGDSMVEAYEALHGRPIGQGLEGLAEKLFDGFQRREQREEQSP